MEPLALTVNDTCRAAGRIGRTVIYEQIKTGKLSVIKIGRRTLIPVDGPRGLKAWLASHEVPPRAEESPA